MPLSAQKQRERRAAQRAAEAQRVRSVPRTLVARILVARIGCAAPLSTASRAGAARTQHSKGGRDPLPVPFGRLPRRTARGARARLEKLRRLAGRLPTRLRCDTSPEMEVEPAAPDAQALATGAAARRRRAWCPTAQEPSTINHYHGCHRRRLRSSSPRPRSDLVPRLSSLQQRRGPRQGVQRRRAGGRGAASYRAVAPAHRAGPLHPEAACGSLPVSPCDPLG
eukprot:CAMPEP_0185399384 /NCGR_PEP_ID=MMETSP1364-20130426/90263_1 /TAXON_ID=38817 /ORGANISM="Gephyrocapsa oceanica, Strain RCC1303" /LENGTH=223 /DNA_ID=CAMNT_0028001669 /DNA_START=109 /DNA_END=780 /DNA_ORIENTATION=-